MTISKVCRRVKRGANPGGVTLTHIIRTVAKKKKCMFSIFLLFVFSFFSHRNHDRVLVFSSIW